MLVTLESTALARWVGESFYAYPGLLACHIIGLAIVVGIFSMRDLKLLGFFPDLDIRVFSSLNRLALAGFTINAISGLLLFSSQASYLATSVPFLTKIACITAGMSLAYQLRPAVLLAATVSGGQQLASPGLTMKAGLSLAIWIGAIIAGRLIAYIF
ncbi:MAG: hypothetical protein O2948_08910 [Proteobacteria bacterium]|nr:hypothetical protein [Pseudomonadota bacterium]MDA0928759.1 hypothetical protein [Pseudomonadota bacterium]